MEQTDTHLKSSSSLAQFAWNAWCCLSIVGIWPRFIEPKLLSTTRLNLKIPRLPKNLQGLKIAQFSDLHLYSEVSDHFLEKIQRKILSDKPDIILFTGDFLCFSLSNDLVRLQRFLSDFHAPYGCYAILGNHDYDEFISVNPRGEYDVLNTSVASFNRLFKRMWTDTKLVCKTTEKALAVKYHAALENLLEKTPFKLLKNETTLVPIKNSFVNITGVEEYITGRCNPSQAFSNYDMRYPGIVMAHNPDSVPTLLKFPGDIILCGHTHGGQVNLPWLWKKFTLMENPQFKKGLFNLHDKWIYVNRGVGGVMQFRWFSMPETLLLTLETAE